MTSSLQLSWQNFEANYLGGPPREVVLPGSLKLRLFVLAQNGGFGMRVPLKAAEIMPGSPINAVRIREVRAGTAPLVEISCIPGAASKEFFYFLLTVADGLELKGLAFTDAFEQAVKAWKDLLRGPARMSEEEELGLFGELLTLGILVEALGPTAISHWTGPTGDKHDFRVHKNEFEVKTTTGSTRIHVINGLNQLAPSQQCRLYVVSWQVERAGPGSGETLAERIAKVRKVIKSQPGAVSQLNALLEKGTGWRDPDASLYRERWRPRDLARVVLVDEACPRITSAVLESGLPSELTALITDLHYRINLEGRGFAHESPQFDRILRGESS